MAYSDYGGYAYRNGVRVIERSDATITPEGDTFGTPGMWPGFGMIADGVPHEEVTKRIEWPHGHSLLGDGPIYVLLRKQWGAVYKGPKMIADADRDFGEDSEKHTQFEIDGHTIEIVNTYEDNYYVYAKLVQPDGTTWHGWSGYGVGAGLEEAGYGFSTKDRIEKMASIWPESIK